MGQVAGISMPALQRATSIGVESLDVNASIRRMQLHRFAIGEALGAIERRDAGSTALISRSTSDISE